MSKLWVTRDEATSRYPNPKYEVWWKRPEIESSIWDCKGPDGYDGDDWPQVGEFCVTHFERLTGIKLKPGEIMECTLSLAPNKEKTEFGLYKDLGTKMLGEIEDIPDDLLKELENE